MITLDEIRQRLVAGTFEFSHHAFKRAVERNISERDIREAGRRAAIIEDYPDDKYAPSCLLLGFTGCRPSLAHSGVIHRISYAEDHYDLSA